MDFQRSIRHGTHWIGKQLSVFPLATKCPICDKPLNIPGTGKYSCSKCKTSFVFNREGKVALT